MKQTLSIVFLFLFLSGIVSCKKDDIVEKEIIEETEEEEIEEEAKLDDKIDAIIPHIYIDIEGEQEVEIKGNYLKASVEVDGMGKFENLSATSTSIKGRGNSTWNKPKKPYRLKLDKKASILGLEAAKNWVLLANYQDYTLMTNAVAMKVGQQLGLPFTHQVIPVDLTVNGKYRGSYNLTQQVEIGKGRIDVGDDGVVLELDNHFDEDYQFRSANLDLPVMVKDAEIDSEDDFNVIQNEFQAFEDLLFAPDFPNNKYGDVFDKKQLANYLIVNDFLANFEINHPKSVYMHKTKGGKYTMGPIWDFDWGYGMDEDSRQYFNYPEVRLLKEHDERNGAVFFKRLMTDPEVKELYVSQWKKYRTSDFDNLMQYIEEYAALIRESQKKDYVLWEVGKNNLPQDKADLKTFLRKRANFIDRYVEELK